MHKVYLFLFLLPFCSFAQIKGTIRDSETKRPVAYVNIWVEGDHNGATADENGEYMLDKADASKMILFSAVGYGDEKIKVSDLKDITYLSPKAIALSEVVIASKKNIKKRIVNPMANIDKANFALSVPSRSPRIAARFIPYKEVYEETPFISEIKFLTISDVKNTLFNVRLYSVNEDGSPGDLLHDEPITGKAAKKESITSVNVSNLNIRIPDKGFFVAIEWLIIKRNEHTVYTAGSGRKGEIFYNPKFIHTYTKNKTGLWIYEKGKWTVYEKDRKYNTIAVEITLTD